MNQKYKIIISLLIIVILGFSYWFFFLKPNLNFISEDNKLKAEQKIDVMKSMAEQPHLVIPNAEKKEILEDISSGIGTAVPMPEEEKMRLLNSSI